VKLKKKNEINKRIQDKKKSRERGPSLKKLKNKIMDPKMKLKIN
jgi:hypothetical protein